MKRFNTMTAAAILGGLLTTAARAQVVYEFNVPGPANWYTSGDWLANNVATAFVPTVDNGEVGAVSNNRSAFVNANMADAQFLGVSANPGSVRVGVLTFTGSGSLLEIRNGGTFRVQPDIGALTNGGVTVGFLGSTGILRVSPGGTMTVDGQLFEDNTGAPNPASRVEVGGAAVGTGTLNVGSAALSGVLQTYANSDFNSLGSLTFNGSAVFRPEIKSAVTNAKVDVTGAAVLGGTLTADFTGFTPTLGQSWTVLEAASIAGNFAVVNSPAVAVGQALIPTDVTIGGGRHQLKVTYSAAVTLNVNRDTGAVSLGNVNAPGVSFDGYGIRSASGKLDPVAWTSLHDLAALGSDWRESNASVTQLAELKPTTFGTVGGNSTQALGKAYNPLAGTFAASQEDLIFDYTLPDGSIVTGNIVYSGTRVNNLLLQVDPATGQAALRNTSQTTASIDGYDIASASSSLVVGTWNSLDDQNAAGGDWRESDALSSRLAELKATSATTLAPGASFDLGHPFSVAGNRDLAFSFLQSANSTATTGAVIYAPIVAGDYNFNGIVDAGDYNIWRDHLGQVFALANRDPANSGVINAADYTFWKSHFGMTSSGSGSGASSSSVVPEPASWLLLGIGAVCCLVRRQRRGDG